MLGQLRRLGRETAVYGLSTVVGRLLNVLLIPLYTHALRPADLGVAAALFSYIAFLNILFQHGMDFAFMRHAQGSEDDRAFSTSFWHLAATALPLAILIHAAAGPLARAAGVPPELADIVRYAAWILAFDALALIPFAQLRISRRPGAYALIKVANIVLNLALSYVFLVVLPMGVRGIFLASFVTACATFAMTSPVLVLRLSPVFDRDLHRSLLKFAWPLVPAGLASSMVQVIDRPILQRLQGSAAAGIYQANYRLGIFMQLVVNVFDAGWRPFFLQSASQPDIKELLARVMTYFCAGSGLVLLAVTFFIGDLVALPLLGGRPLIHPDYWAGLSIVPVVTFAYLLNGVYYNLLAPVTLAKRTDLVAYATGAGAVVNIAANLLWIPRFGMMGAACATLAAYAAMAAALFIASRKVYPVDYEYGRLLHLAAALAAILAAFHFLPPAGPPARLARRGGLLLSFPVLLLATGFLKADEREALLGLLKPKAGSASEGPPAPEA